MCSRWKAAGRKIRTIPAALPDSASSSENSQRGRARRSKHRTRARLKDELKAIDRQTVRDIYFINYWKAAGCSELPQALALMHFDAAVNHGVGAAIRFLQQAVGAGVDGEIGPDTRAAIEACAAG